MTGEVQSEGSEEGQRAHVSEGVVKAMLARVLKPWAARAAATEGGAPQDARSVCKTRGSSQAETMHLAAGQAKQEDTKATATKLTASQTEAG